MQKYSLGVFQNGTKRVKIKQYRGLEGVKVIGANHRRSSKRKELFPGRKLDVWRASLGGGKNGQRDVGGVGKRANGSGWVPGDYQVVKGNLEA